jgi:hypothetical protein
VVPGARGGGMPGSWGWIGLAFWRFFPGRGLAKRQLNHPTRRISLRSASAFVNSAFTCGEASVLQRSCSITRRARLMRSQGCARGGRRCRSLALRPARVHSVGALLSTTGRARGESESDGMVQVA